MKSPKQLIRKPKQQRSQVTVSAIVEAASQLLSSQEYAKTTTNHIAQRAGVSVGSLYQYFNNKTEIFDAVLDASFERIVLAMQDTLPIEDHVELDQVIYSLAFAAHSAAPETPLLLRRLRQAPGTHFQEKLGNAKQHIVNLLREVLLQRGFEATHPELELRLQIVINAVEGIYINASDDLDAPTLAAELARNLSSYLLD